MDPKQEKNFIDIPRHRISERRPAKLGPDRPLRDSRAENDLAASPPCPDVIQHRSTWQFLHKLAVLPDCN
jgi:hypothetical protein